MTTAALPAARCTARSLRRHVEGALRERLRYRPGATPPPGTRPQRGRVRPRAGSTSRVRESLQHARGGWQCLPTVVTTAAVRVPRWAQAGLEHLLAVRTSGRCAPHTNESSFELTLLAPDLRRRSCEGDRLGRTGNRSDFEARPATPPWHSR